MANGDSTSGTLRYFGSQLRLWRVKAGLSREQLAEAIGYSLATVQSVELGRRMPQQSFIDAADDVLGAGGMLTAGATHLARERVPNWFQDYLLVESEAVSFGIYECMVVPGLFQTEAYVRAINLESCPPLTDPEIDERVAVRLKRQEIWGRARPPMASGVLEEAALRRIVGGPEVMKGQVLQLIELAQRRNIALQVMPTDSGTHPGISGPITLVESVDHRNLAYVEYQGGGILISEAEDVSVLAQRFGMIRAKALTPEESLRFLEGLGEEL
jgi:transcriptional regulator with XRE-family HTH domain